MSQLGVCLQLGGNPRFQGYPTYLGGPAMILTKRQSHAQSGPGQCSLHIKNHVPWKTLPVANAPVRNSEELVLQAAS